MTRSQTRPRPTHNAPQSRRRAARQLVELPAGTTTDAACVGCHRLHDHDAAGYHASRYWTRPPAGLLCRTCRAQLATGRLAPADLGRCADCTTTPATGPLRWARLLTAPSCWLCVDSAACQRRRAAGRARAAAGAVETGARS